MCTPCICGSWLRSWLSTSTGPLPMRGAPAASGGFLDPLRGGSSASMGPLHSRGASRVPPRGTLSPLGRVSSSRRRPVIRPSRSPPRSRRRFSGRSRMWAASAVVPPTSTWAGSASPLPTALSATPSAPTRMWPPAGGCAPRLGVRFCRGRGRRRSARRARRTRAARGCAGGFRGRGRRSRRRGGLSATSAPPPEPNGTPWQRPRLRAALRPCSARQLRRFARILQLPMAPVPALVSSIVCALSSPGSAPCPARAAYAVNAILRNGVSVDSPLSP
mmetsp:Transcript_17469/g.54664  ORF Transcript_17469/g.54664 Transcript_17469/m.54664 type:complete len:275 (-) Transcript_17469:12-836(-)